MARILVNGSSAKSGGGRSILRNFLGALAATKTAHDYLVAVPPAAGYEEFAREGIRIVPIAGLDGLPALYRFTLFGLPRLLRADKCELLFNLADVPVPTEIPQVFLFDWAYAAFPESPAWGRSGFTDRLVRNAKLHLFRRFVRHIDVLVTQTDLLKTRMQRLYGVEDVEVVPNAVSLENLSAGDPFDFDLGGGFKLLCLSGYYTHKNIEIFLPVARLIRDRMPDLKIVMTLAAEQHPKARGFLEAVRSEELDRIVVNIGPVPMSRVPSLYRQCDALLLPTLLESFSGTYVEAMFHQKPILTSRLEFAEGVCRDAAYYFDPADPEEILARIIEVRADPAEAARRIARGAQILNELPNWKQAAEAFVAIFNRVLAAHAPRSADRAA